MKNVSIILLSTFFLASCAQQDSLIHIKATDIGPRPMPLPEIWPNIVQFGGSGWENSAYNTGSKRIVADSAGNVYFIGDTNGPLAGAGPIKGKFDAFLAKYDKNGVRKWTKRQEISTTENDRPTSLAINSKGQIVIVGNTDGQLYPGAKGNSFLALYNSDGTHEWTTQIDSARGIIINSADEIFLIGSDGTKTVIKKFDSDGNPVSQFNPRAKFPKPDDYSYSIEFIDTNAKDELYLAGTRVPAGPASANAWLAKYDTSGQLVWLEEFGSTDYDEMYSMAVSPINDEIFLSGYTKGTMPGETSFGDDDGWVAVYKDNGMTQSQTCLKQLGSDGLDGVHSVSVDATGKGILVGNASGSMPFAATKYVPGNGASAWVSRFDSATCRNEWGKQLPLRNDPDGFAAPGYLVSGVTVIPGSPNNEFHMIGWTKVPLAGPVGGYSDFWLLKGDGDGNLGF